MFDWPSGQAPAPQGTDDSGVGCGGVGLVHCDGTLKSKKARIWREWLKAGEMNGGSTDKMLSVISIIARVRPLAFSFIIEPRQAVR